MVCPVVLNVYDITPQNDWTYWLGVGIFHAGVEVYGVEYAYGGHEYDLSGVFATNPRDAPGPVTFRESITVGTTDMSPAQVQQLVQQLGASYRGNRYHLLQCNCNHFADELCQLLCGHGVPPWVNRLAGIAVSLHCLLPTTWVPALKLPTAVPAPDSQGRGLHAYWTKGCALAGGLDQPRGPLLTRQDAHRFTPAPRNIAS